MNKYTIHCTPEQTKKALALGAPIEIKYGSIAHSPSIEELEYLIQHENMWNKIPTAEQMTGWIEDQGIKCTIFSHTISGQRRALVFINNNTVIADTGHLENTREATLAAIDAALEYLENLKQ